MSSMNWKIIRKNRYIKNLFTDKHFILTVMAIILSWSLIYLVFFYKPVYKSKASVLIKDNSNQSYVTAQTDESSDIRTLTATGNPILNQIEILNSHELSRIVSTEIIKKHPDFKNKIKNQEKLTKQILKVKNKIGTDTIDITLVWDNPELAKEFLQATLEEYKSINLNINKEIKTNRRKYIDQKIDEIESKLYEVRNQIKNYKQGRLAINLDEESKSLIEQKANFINRLENNKAYTESAISTFRELQKQLSMETNEAINAVALGADNKNLSDLRATLDQATQQYDFDSIKMTQTNPKMVALKLKIEKIESQIQNQITLTLGKKSKSNQISIYDSVRTKLVSDLATAQTNLISLQAEKRSIESTLTEINNLQSQIPVTKFTLDNLEQEEQNLSTAYNELRKKQIEAKIKEAETVSNLVIIDSPTLPDSTSFPNQFHIIFLASILGVSLGVILSIIKTNIEDICYGVDSIEEATKIPVLGGVPWLEDNNSQINQAIRKFAYKNILSSFIIKCYKRNANVITFTSTALEKANSQTVYSFALELKKQGHSVAIVDADFRKPTLFKNASIPESECKELSELIAEVDKSIRNNVLIDGRLLLNTFNQDKNGICILANNNEIYDPYEYFGTNGFITIIKTLKENFNWVLVNAPSAAIAPEFLIISNISDGVVLLANLKATYSVLNKIARTVKESDIPIIGTIIREQDSDFEKNLTEYINQNSNNKQSYVTDENEKQVI